MRKAIAYAFALAIAPSLIVAPAAPSFASERTEPGTLIGVIVGADKKPMSGTRVLLQDGRTGAIRSLTTSSDGAFGFKGLTTGQNYLLRITTSRGRKAWKKVRIQPYGNDPVLILIGTPSAPG